MRRPKAPQSQGLGLSGFFTQRYFLKRFFCVASRATRPSEGGAEQRQRGRLRHVLLGGNAVRGKSGGSVNWPGEAGEASECAAGAYNSDIRNEYGDGIN